MNTPGTNDFYAKLRHEIRNNLTLLSSRLQLLANKYAFLQSDDIYMQLLEDIRLTHVILDNATLSCQSPRLLPCDIRQLLHKLYKACLPMFQLNEKKLLIQMPDSLPLIRADSQQLYQALLNLIKNAAEATAEGQQVCIQVCVKNNYLVITVSDNGIGMTPEQQSHIFEAYTSYKQGGTGLGLHMVKSVIYAHHGQLDCQSQPSKGSIFRIALPLPSPSIQQKSH